MGCWLQAEGVVLLCCGFLFFFGSITSQLNAYKQWISLDWFTPHRCPDAPLCVWPGLSVSPRGEIGESTVENVGWVSVEMARFVPIPASHLLPRLKPTQRRRAKVREPAAAGVFTSSFSLYPYIYLFF